MPSPAGGAHQPSMFTDLCTHPAAIRSAGHVVRDSGHSSECPAGPATPRCRVGGRAGRRLPGRPTFRSWPPSSEFSGGRSAHTWLVTREGQMGSVVMNRWTLRRSRPRRSPWLGAVRYQRRLDNIAHSHRLTGRVIAPARISFSGGRFLAIVYHRSSLCDARYCRSRFPAAAFRLPVPGCRFSTAASRLPRLDCRFPREAALRVRSASPLVTPSTS